jgi:pimeloyl-ACP methyl ester carboxylesterase
MMKTRIFRELFVGLTLCIALTSEADGQRSAGPPVTESVGAANPAAIATQVIELPSAILGETRRIHIALPASYPVSSPTRRYPVVVVVDGEVLTAQVATVGANLTRFGQIPESIIVGIENTNRLRDLTPPGLSVSGSGLSEGGDKFIDFIEKELLPLIDSRYRGGAPRTFVGHSSGGILATYIAATRPGFAAIIAIDTPMHLGDGWLAARLMSRAKANPAEPLHYVSLETRFGWSDRQWGEIRDAIPAKWQFHRQKLEHETHESMTMLSAYLGLREVFRGYSTQVAPVAPTTSILPYYAKVGETFGATLLPPRRILTNVTEDLLAEGRGQAAREAFEALVTAYGPPADAAALTARIAEVEKRPPPSETVEGLLATPFSSASEAQRFVGDWRGDHWMNPEEPRTGRQTLRIRIEDGKVVGETVTRIADEEMVQKWTYFRVTKDGITFGFMNGMRPRGMILHEAKLEGDALKGTSRFGGIDFVLPDGTRPPLISFEYKRVRN